MPKIDATKPVTVSKFTEEEEGKVFPGTNGKFYVVVANGNVKKVATHGLKEFIKNNDINPLEEEFAAQNTQVLLRLLRKEFPQTEFVRGSVYVQGWRIRYASHGYEIIDKWNFGERLNKNKYNNDFEKPEDVLEYVRKHISKKRLHSPPVPKPAPKTPSVPVGKLASKYKVAVDKKTRKAEEKKRMDALNEQIRKRDEEIRKRDEKVKKDKAKIKKALKPRRVKMFRGLPEEYPIVEAYEKKGIVHYKVQGPSRKIEKKLPVHVFLVNFLIEENANPRMMAMFMRAAMRGEKFNIDTLSPTKWVLDPYIAYDAKVIANTRYRNHVRKLAENVMLFQQIVNPLNVLYTTEYKKGDEIRVLFKDQSAWYYAKVLSTHEGLYVQLEEGSYHYVLNHQKIERVKRK